MSSKSITTIATMGIDIGKNSFHVVGLIDARPQSRQIDETSCDARPDHTYGSKAAVPIAWPRVRSSFDSRRGRNSEPPRSGVFVYP